MVNVTYGLLAVSLVIFFGFFAEFIFKKFNIPDILFLVILGFLLGPYALNYISADSVSSFAPFFTAFTLLFLLFDGAFNIDLASFAKGLSFSLGITLLNFFVSSSAVAVILILFKFKIATAILAGFILGGISSAFVIPVLKQLNVKGEIYSMLTIESALTDVFCIVFSLTTMEIIMLNSFNLKVVSSQLASLFAVAGLIGIVSGILWIMIVTKILKRSKSYMATIAYLILVFVITESLGGNGAIACLFFGLMLKNSKQLTAIFSSVVNKINSSKKKAEDYIVSATSPTEQLFYSQISFFLKTFFFVYIGILFNIKDLWTLLIAALLAVAIMLSRNISNLATKKFSEGHRKIVTSVFARGLAAAAIAQVVIAKGIQDSYLISSIVYPTIVFTILLSSVRIFLLKKAVTN